MSYDFISLDFRRLESEEQRRRAVEFYELMRRRRTVREFSPDPAPFELIEMAIKTAGAAPSSLRRWAARSSTLRWRRWCDRPARI